MSRPRTFAPRPNPALENVPDQHRPRANKYLGQDDCGYFIRFLFYVDVTYSCHVFVITYRALPSTRNGF